MGTVPGRAWLRPPTESSGLAEPATVIRRHGRGSRRRRWHELRERRREGIFLLPSLLTTGNLFCGFFALLLTVENRYTEAALAIFVAMIMDILDGRVARLMKATSQFGLEFDSRSEEHTSELQSLAYLVCRLLLEKKKKRKRNL